MRYEGALDMKCVKCHEDVEKYLLMREDTSSDEYIRICIPCFKKRLKHIKSVHVPIGTSDLNH